MNIAEYLKIDFHRVTNPKDAATFWQLVKLGGEIRQVHLLEAPQTEDYITTYPENGNNVVTHKLTKTNVGFELTNEKKQTDKVWINDDQYFEGVPLGSGGILHWWIPTCSEVAQRP